MWHHGFESKWEIVRAIYTKSHFIVMDVYFILIKFCYFIYDGAFSIKTGLELAGVAGPFIGPDKYNIHRKVVRWGCVGHLFDA